MRLRHLKIENFRRITYAEILLEPSTFLIGPNNSGKSSIIASIEALLSLESDKLTQADILELSDGTRADSTIITGSFCDISADIAASRGFKGRVIGGEFVYRKTLSISSSKPEIETREYPFSIRPEFASCKTIADLGEVGLSVDAIKDGFGDITPETKLKKGWERSVPDVLEFDTSAEPTWIKNPEGIPQNVLSRLPRLIHVPAVTNTRDIESGEKRYILGECLSLLFEDLIQDNPVAKTIQDKLADLEKQMNPSDEQSLIFTLLQEVNTIVADVFPNCGISIVPSLQELLDVLKPKYEINVFSNIKTGAERQGTGLVRTCVFAMLRHHARMKIEKDLQTRPVIVAFEEPELYLHPSAANMLRDTIYELGQTDQIVCSTHSPWMIDLSKDPQSLLRMYLKPDDMAAVYNYGVSSTLGSLQDDDKQRVKMLQVFDDELSRVFFADKVVIVEGDSEVLTIRQTLKLLPAEARKVITAKYQIVKARGKASIISLVKYLRAMGISPRVMHDGDFGTEGAEKFNQPIAEAVESPNHVVVLNKNLEEVLGYAPPSRDKPFTAYEHVRTWTSSDNVPERWRETICSLFDIDWPD